MLARPIKFDPLFNEIFFSFGQQKEFSIAPLSADFPSSPEGLSSFFASDAGKKFKESISEEVDKLIAWADKNNIASSYLVKFKKVYVDYSGSNPENNALYFPLYQQGMPALKNINEILQSSPTTNFNRTIIQNLIQDLAKCAPGAYSIIIDAYVDLLANKNSSLRLMSTRRKIAQQFVAELLKPFNIRTDFEIHYINGVLNYFSDAIGINSIEDGYIKFCDQGIFDRLSDLFHGQIGDKITLDAVLYQLYDKLDLQDIIQQLNLLPNSTTMIYENFIQELNQHGKDEQFYQTDNIFLTEDYVTYHQSWKSHYILFLSLFTRLSNEGLLKPVYSSQEISDEGTIHYFPNRSMLFAYVFIPSAKTHERYVPFIAYCIDVLAFKDQAHQDELIAFLTSDHLTNTQRYEVIQGIIDYLNSMELNESNDKKEQINRLVNHILELDPLLHHWQLILSRVISEKAVESYCNAINLPTLLPLINNENLLFDFVKLMSYLSKDKVQICLDHASNLSFTVNDLLFIAAKQSNPETVLELVARGADPHKTNRDGDNALIVAVKHGCIAIVKVLLAMEVDPNFTDENEVEPIKYALTDGQLEIAKLLLQNGANPNTTNKSSGASILMWTSKHGHLEIVNLLLTLGANINHQDNKGKTAILEASYNGNPDIIRALLAKGADPNHANSEGTTALLVAAENNQLEAVNLLIGNKVNVNHTNKRGHSALMWACHNGNMKMVESLLASDVEINVANDEGNTALTFSVRKGNLEIVKALLLKKANPDLTLKDGNTALMIAAEQGQLDILNALLAANANPNLINKKGDSALLLAIKKGHVEVVKALLEKGADPNLIEYGRNTPFMYAVDRGKIAIIKALLEKGVNPNSTSASGMSYLLWACIQGRSDIVKTFLEYGANVNAADKKGYSVLMWASQNGHHDVVEMLLARGVNIHSTDENEHTAIMFAVEGGHIEIVKTLLARDANIHQINGNGETTLMLAARENNLEMVKLFLGKDVDPNKVIKNQPSALFWAAQHGNMDMVKMLLAKDANPEISYKNTAAGWRDFARTYNVEARMKDFIVAKENKKDFTPLLFQSEIPITAAEIAHIMEHEAISSLIRESEMTASITPRTR